MKKNNEVSRFAKMAEKVVRKTAQASVDEMCLMWIYQPKEPANLAARLAAKKTEQ